MVCFFLLLKRERKQILTLAAYFLHLGIPSLPAHYPLTLRCCTKVCYQLHCQYGPSVTGYFAALCPLTSTHPDTHWLYSQLRTSYHQDSSSFNWEFTFPIFLHTAPSYRHMDQLSQDKLGDLRMLSDHPKLVSLASAWTWNLGTSMSSMIPYFRVCQLVFFRTLTHLEDENDLCYHSRLSLKP